MKLYLSFPKDLPRTALTIGTFDGVHLGHQALLKRLRAISSHTTVLTFLNHPFSLLKPPAPPLLTHFSLKLSLFASLGIDAVIALPFTTEFAALPYDALLSHFDLSHLLLGTGSAFGKNRQGTPENLRYFPFALEYFPKQTLDGAPISSSRIRTALTSGDLATAARLLGRPYCIPYPLPPNLLLPPDGTYPVRTEENKALLTLQNGQALLDPEPEENALLFFSCDP